MLPDVGNEDEEVVKVQNEEVVKVQVEVQAEEHPPDNTQSDNEVVEVVAGRGSGKVATSDAPASLSGSRHIPMSSVGGVGRFTGRGGGGPKGPPVGDRGETSQEFPCESTARPLSRVGIQTEVPDGLREREQRARRREARRRHISEELAGSVEDRAPLTGLSWLSSVSPCSECRLSGEAKAGGTPSVSVSPG